MIIICIIGLTSCSKNDQSSITTVDLLNKTFSATENVYTWYYINDNKIYTSQVTTTYETFYFTSNKELSIEYYNKFDADVKDGIGPIESEKTFLHGCTYSIVNDSITIYNINASRVRWTGKYKYPFLILKMPTGRTYVGGDPVYTTAEVTFELQK